MSCPNPNSLGGHTYEATPSFETLSVLEVYRSARQAEAICIHCGRVFVPSYVPDDNPQEES